MIIADATVWTAALRAESATLESLFEDLRLRDELTAPGLVFAELASQLDDEQAVSRLRTWAMQVPPIDQPMSAWLAAGDVGALIAGHGVPMSLLDAYVVTLALREDCLLWSFNPRFERVERVVPLRRFVPTGLD